MPETKEMSPGEIIKNKSNPYYQIGRTYSLLAKCHKDSFKKELALEYFEKAKSYFNQAFGTEVHRKIAKNEMNQAMVFVKCNS